MRRNYFRRTPRTQRRTTRRRNYNLLGKRNNTLIVVGVIIIAYVLWRYPDAVNRLLQQSPPAPSFPQARP